MPRYKTVNGGHVSIFVPWQPNPIEIMADDSYETDDEREIEALKGSSEVFEAKEGDKSRPAAREVEAEKPAAPVEHEEEVPPEHPLVKESAKAKK